MDSLWAALRASVAGRGPVAHAALLIAGGAAALGFAPLNLWPLTLLGLAFLLERGWRAAHAREAFVTGWTFSLGHFLVSLNWIAESFRHQSAMPGWLGWLAVSLLSAYLAVFMGLACALAWRLSGGSRGARSQLAWVLLLAASWMLCEWARSGAFGGFAWDPLAVIWIALPAVAQADQWVGPYALSGLVVLTAGALWLGLKHRWRTTAVVALAGAALAAWLLGQEPAAAGTGKGTAAAGVPVHIVQPNINEDEKHDAALTDVNLDRYITLSTDEHSAPRLLLWPEGALERFLDVNYARRLPRQFIAPLELARNLRAGDILLTGGPSVLLDLQGAGDELHNSVFGISSNGALLWRYDKAHLVPLGEFLPARPILSHLGLSRLVPGGKDDFTPGPGPRTFELPGFTVHGQPLTVGLQICYEIIFAGRVVDEAHRPAFIYNPSNDAWFASWGPPQHLAQAQLRAIEEGLPVIRATPNGISAVISPHGRVLRRIDREHAGTIDMELPAALPPTLFSRLGLWSSGIVGVLLGAAGLGLSRGRWQVPRTRAALAHPQA